MKSEMSIMTCCSRKHTPVGKDMLGTCFPRRQWNCSARVAFCGRKPDKDLVAPGELYFVFGTRSILNYMNSILGKCKTNIFTFCIVVVILLVVVVVVTFSWISDPMVFFKEVHVGIPLQLPQPLSRNKLKFMLELPGENPREFQSKCFN